MPHTGNRGAIAEEEQLKLAGFIIFIHFCLFIIC
jgi:hypothetical protein